MAAPRKPRPVTKSGRPRARRGVKLKPTELGPTDVAVPVLEGPARALADAVLADGGAVLAAYREPLGGHVQLFVSLPIDRVEPTVFQRDVSDAHVRKLTLAMDRTRRFLDPVIAVRQDGAYLTPNGAHRLTALKELGAKSILALLVLEPEVAFQILALNIEKAHNLRERALEVARMYQELAAHGDRRETDCVLEFEEPALITLGFAYQDRGRLSGGAYHPMLKKVDAFLEQKLKAAEAERRRRPQVVLALDDAVTSAVEKLKSRGMTSPYLRSFVVARINPLRFMKGKLPSFDALMETVTRRAQGINIDKVRPEDVAKSGGAPETE